MGVIARQTLKSSAVGYAAAIVGIINTFFIYTLCFDEAEFGRFRYIQEMGIVLASIFSLGITNVVVRFFPEFRNKDNQNNGFLGFITLVLVSGITVFSIVYSLTWRYWPTSFQENFWYIFFLFIAVAFSSLLYYFSSNFRLITIPNVFRQFWIKIGLGVCALAFFYFDLSYGELLGGVVIVYTVAMIGLLFYLIYQENFSLRLNIKFLTAPRIKKIAVFAGFGIMGSLGSGLANKLDVFMVAEMLNFSRTGIYSIAMSITGIMMLATGPLLSISGPIVADSIARDDLKHVEEVYKKSSVNLFLFGSFLLLLILVNVDAIFALIPNGENYVDGKIVIVILGIAALVDMVTGVNELIIAYSKYFRFNLYAILLLGVLNIGANLFFIPRFDIAGAALATCLSVVLYNTVKTYYIYCKFRIHPFQLSLFWITLFGLLSYFVLGTMIAIPNPYISIALKSFLLLFFYVWASLRWEFSAEINYLWSKTRNWVLTIFRK